MEASEKSTIREDARVGLDKALVSPELSVVIPTFNERENLAILIPQIQNVFQKNGLQGEIIVVDDNSTDGSQEVLAELAKTHQNLVVSIRKGPPSIARSWFEGFELASKENI